MTNALGIAAVTAVLKDLLNNGVIANDLASTLGTVKVTARAPDRVPTGGPTGTEEPQLNLFLYHVTPNAAFVNDGLPVRGPRGERLSRPPLALNLHYLLTAYGSEDFHSEILLGYAMQLIHEHSSISRDEIRAALTPTSPVSGGILPPAYQLLRAAELADQVELIKIVPETLSTEEISKLWAAFQTHYRPTAAYKVSVLLIEAVGPTRRALPVLRRVVDAHASLQSPYPTLLSLEPPNAQPAIRMGEDLVLHGHHLDGTNVSVRFTHLPSGRTLTLPSATSSAASVTVHLPDDPPLGPVTPGSAEDPESWVSGQYTVAVIAESPPDPARTSNEIPIVLAPSIQPPISVATASGTVTLVVPVVPKAWRGQRTTLVVADRELALVPFSSAKSGALEFRASQASLPSGNQHLRLRIDGSESLLIDRSGSVPVFDPSQQVAWP